MIDVSVIIPVYNVQNYLEECLDSVIDQQGVSLEIICVNDGSTDGSAAILDRYAKKDERIVVYNQPNSGLAMARNSGMEIAKGRYICFLDSDDFLLPDTLHKVFKKAVDDKLDFASFDTIIQYDNEKYHTKDKDKYYIKDHTYNGVRTGKELFTDMVENDDYNDSAWLVLLDRLWLEDTGIRFYPGIYYEDVLFILKCYFSGKRVEHISLDVHVYRVRDNSIMTNKYSSLNLYSAIVNYRELLKVLFGLDEDEIEVRDALIKYMYLTINKIKYIDNAQTDLDSDLSLSTLDEMIISSFGIGQWKSVVPDRTLLGGLERFVELSDETVIYGAGTIGKMLFEYLKGHGLADKVKCFAITDRKEKEILFDKDVLCINDIELDKCSVIVATSGKYREEMKGYLSKLCPKESLYMDWYTERALYRYFEQE